MDSLVDVRINDALEVLKGIGDAVPTKWQNYKLTQRLEELSHELTFINRMMQRLEEDFKAAQDPDVFQAIAGMNLRLEEDRGKLIKTITAVNTCLSRNVSSGQ